MKNNTRNLVVSALFAAIIMVFTSYIKVNTGINSGYVHFGDSMIYLAACILPLPYAMGAAAIGGALADVLAGVPIWAPATAIIKALNVLPFALIFIMNVPKDKYKIMCISTVTMSIVSGFITIFGYLLAETILYSFEAALLSVPFSIIQGVGSSIIFAISATALDCAKFKSRICN